MTITDLPLFAARHREPADCTEIITVLRALTGAGWKTARQLGAMTGFNERTLRSLANASDGQIISGQQGYKLTREATRDEIHHAANWLKHQAAEMQRRAIAIEKQGHA